jgi:hypothetical protein
MKAFSIIVVVFISVTAVFVALTYPGYYREMQVRKARLSAGSDILKTHDGYSPAR